MFLIPQFQKVVCITIIIRPHCLHKGHKKVPIGTDVAHTLVYVSEGWSRS